MTARRRLGRLTSAPARLVVDGRDVAPVELALSNRERRRGLLGRDGLTGALWLEPCRQVHTLRMRFAIDVAHLDRGGTVLAARTLRPWRVGPLLPRTRTVVEATAGAFVAWGLDVGSVVKVLPVGSDGSDGADGPGQRTQSGRS